MSVCKSTPGTVHTMQVVYKAELKGVCFYSYCCFDAPMAEANGIQSGCKSDGDDCSIKESAIYNIQLDISYPVQTLELTVVGDT